ncbi:MAG: hypothetical protein RIR25_225 [Verrucomicrobiota bacterium]|jgi:phosphatidylglycerophosphatase A
MSDSSASSAASDRVTARLRLLAPGGKWKIFDGTAQETDTLEAFAVVSRVPAEKFSGFVLIARKQHHRSEKLGNVLRSLTSGFPFSGWLSQVFDPAGVVGARLTQVAVPGMNEYYFCREGLSGNRSSFLCEVAGDVLLTSGGLGHLLLIGATASSAATCLVAVALSFFLSGENWQLCQLLIALVASLVCIVGEKWAHRHYLAEDPREVVLDEVAGMALALAIVGPGLGAVFFAFFAFRFFDIFKPGIHWIEGLRWRGTIVWDDLLAGIYAGGLVSLAIRLVSG